MFKQVIKWVVPAVVAAMACSCQNEDPRKPATDPRGDDYTIESAATVSDSRAAELTVGQNEFAYGLIQNMIQAEAGNLVYSPMAVYDFLTTLANGTDGKTSEQIVEALSAGSVDELVALCRRQLDAFARIEAANAAEIADLEQGDNLSEETYNNILNGLLDLQTRTSLANALWLNAKKCSPFQAFTEESEQWLKADVKNLDFGLTGAQEINRWFSEKTGGQLGSMLDESKSMQGDLVCTNALYMNAKWNDGMKNMEEKQTFRNLDGTQSQVPFITKYSAYAFDYAENAEAQLVAIELGSGINYGNPSGAEAPFSFEIVMPKGAVNPARMFDSSVMSELHKNLKHKTVEIEMPQFGIETNLDNSLIVSALEQSGMTDVFKKSADFSRMSGNSIQSLSVAHKAKVNVFASGVEDREGASYELYGSSSKPVENLPEALKVRIDRPFAFQITDNQTGMILYAGVVNKL